jgi:hypothetical protein
MTLLMLALWLALDIQGTLTCPTPGEVSQHLTRLSPERARAEQAPHAYLSSGESFVTIELLAPDGNLLAERRLDRSGSCSEMAEAVAVVLAAWQAQFSPTVAPTAIDPPAPAPAPVAPPPEATPKRPLLFDAGIAGLTSIVGSQAAFGGKLQGVLTPFPHVLGLGLGLAWAISVSSNHSQSVPDSPLTTDVKAEWIRPTLTLGPNLRLQGDALALDIHGSAVLALLHVKGVNGSGLDTPASDTSAQFGLAGGLRGLWTWPKAAVWVGADLLGFPGQDNLTIGNSSGNSDPRGHLPHLEIQASLGVSLGRFR